MLRPFEILAPRTLDRACEMLAEYGPDSAVYAGGTELLLMMKEGLVHYPMLIDIKRTAGLSAISLNEQALRIGALATHREIEKSEAVRDRMPELARVESQVANVRVRAAGTLGGNLCFGEPHSDPATFILAWGGEVELASASGERRVPVDEFFLGLFETARQPDEIMVAVNLPFASPGTGAGYQKFSLHERPTATAAAVVHLSADQITSARLAAGSVGPRPVRISGAEALLVGQQPSDNLFAEAGQIVADEIEPVDDLYGSAEYKRHIIAGLTVKVLRDATARARNGTRREA